MGYLLGICQEIARILKQEGFIASYEQPSAKELVLKMKYIGGKTPALSELDPHFFADFRVMPNGDYFVVNSQADSNNAASVQLSMFRTEANAPG